MPLSPIQPIPAPRVLVRAIGEADLGPLMEVNGDDAVTQFLPYATWRTLADASAWLDRMLALATAGTGRQLVIERLDDRQVIGTVLLFNFDENSARVALGYALGRAHWRQGLATEAVRAVCSHAFRHLSIRRIEAEVDPRNAGSNALLKGLGFVQEGLLRQRWMTKGAACDTFIYGRLADEWPNGPHRAGREPSMIHIREIDHLVLRVIDLNAMLRFYCEVLGCTVERRDDAIGLVQLRTGRSLLDLVPVNGRLGQAGGAPPAAEGRNLDHFCFRVEPFDEVVIRAQLAAHGVEAGPTATRNGAEGEGPSIYLADPEGNVVELKGPANDA